MKNRFLSDRRGSAAVEFALIGPVIVVAAIGGLELGLALWQWNAMQTVALTTARCAAIGSPLCATVPAGCASPNAGICYALSLGRSYGLTTLSATDVVINPAVAVGGVAFTKVNISSRFSVFQTPFPMSVTASFPNS